MATTRRSRVWRIIHVFIAVCLLCFPAYAQYAGGTGEPNDPYLIYTAEQMNAIGSEPNDWDRHFRLMADIDLSGVDFNPIGYWQQGVDADSRAFTGVFDGNAKSIVNLTCISPWGYESAGLFQYVCETRAEIKNLTLVNPTVNWNFAGPLAGCLEGGSVRGCTVIGGFVTGSNVGGLIGFVEDGLVENCTVIAGSVNGGIYVGGMVGQVRSGVVRGCNSSAAVNGKGYLGSLVGLCRDDTLITNCGATGAVNGTGNYVGGLVGNCEEGSGSGCVIAGSFASGDVSGYSSIGGLVGSLSYSWIVCSYATGHVSGVGNVGGLVGGLFAPRIIDSYAAGQVKGTGNNVGGFSGDDWPPAYDCFWDTETSGMSTSGLGRGLSTLQMHDPNTFISAGWDFVGESANGPSDIWIMPEGGGYPILYWQVSPLPPLPAFSGGTGEPNDPFIISTPQELNSIGHNPRLMPACFKLANDVNLAGINFFLIGNEGYPFRGMFDGNDYKIFNFSHEASNKYRQNIGLFKYVRGLGAEIRNLILTNSTVTNEIKSSSWDTSFRQNIGSVVGLLYDGTVFNCHVKESKVSAPGYFGENIGGLIGCNLYGIVERCSSEATVTSELQSSGGLVGWNHNGVILSCNSSGDVRGHWRVGGIAGSNWYLIMSCQASGNVSGDEYVGGLVGDNLNTIIASCSYATVLGDISVGGLVGRNLGHIENSYARATVSGNDSVGGLVGDNTYIPRIKGTIAKSYSTSFVSGKKNVGGLTYRSHTAATTSDDCFWDGQTSGQSTSNGGIGKTTAEMQTASTFLNAGWDFMGETANGAEDIWWILEGKDYPRLWWEGHSN